MLCPIHIVIAVAALLTLVLGWIFGRRARRLTPTELTRRRYDRVASFYDVVEGVMELGLRRWRRDLWARVPPGRTLELGIGTGRSLRFYPAQAEVVAIDLSPRMLARACRRAARLGIEADLRVADAQALPFPDASFDTVLATCLFCSVPDPVQGLREARRVLKPGGRLLLLEHVLSRRPVLGRIMRWLDPLVVRLWGAHIARDTVTNVRTAGFAEPEVANLVLDVVERITAIKEQADDRCAIAPPQRALTPTEHELVIYKSPSCMCCGKWEEHLRAHGFEVVPRPTEDMAAVKKAQHLPTALASCHTAVVGGYVIEGHVPAHAITRLLSERPAARGLVVPGMPSGSPGMAKPGREGGYDVLLLREDGTTELFEHVSQGGT